MLLSNLVKLSHLRFNIKNNWPNPCWNIILSNPADTDLFKTPSGRLKKVPMSYDQTRRRHDFWKKTSDLWRLEDVWLTLSWRLLIWDVLKTSDLQRLLDVWFLKTSNLRRFGRRPIYDILKTSDLRRLENVWFMPS